MAPAGSGMGRRRIIKAAAILITLGYSSLLVYQGGVNFNFQESRSVQVADLSIEPVNKTSILDSGQSKNITLDDIFISVKTTKHYQHTRLPVILKTWFQLAKEQVSSNFLSTDIYGLSTQKLFTINKGFQPHIMKLYLQQ